MDYNNDGVLDLIFGERSGNLKLYSGNGDGTLHFEGNIYDNTGIEIKTNFNSSPYLEDWNEDGYLDLVLGGYMVESTTGGILHVYLNTGDDPDSPVFPAAYIDYTSFYNKWRTTHQPFDLDNDGDKDLVLGYEMGDVYYAENIGTNEDPQFSSYATLNTDGGPMNVYTNYQGGGRARENVFDYNDDGIPDILSGCSAGWIYVFLGYDSQGIEDGSVEGEANSVSIALLGVPTSGSFSLVLTAPAGESVTVTVYDAAGHSVVREIELTAGTYPFDISDKPAGLYFVTVVSEGAVLSERLIKLN